MGPHGGRGRVKVKGLGKEPRGRITLVMHVPWGAHTDTARRNLVIGSSSTKLVRTKRMAYIYVLLFVAT